MCLGGVLWISSDSNDRIMGSKIKDPKNFPGQFQQNPQKSVAQTLTLFNAAKCKTNAKGNNIDVKCNKNFNAQCNNLST